MEIGDKKVKVNLPQFVDDALFVCFKISWLLKIYSNVLR